jgi:ribulose-phosphate 3-epimerase
VSGRLDLTAGGPHLSVGAAAADLLHLGDELDRVAAAGVRLVHVDVMDGVFCPTVTVGVPFVKAVARVAATDVHLMVADPLSCVAEYLAAGAAAITFQVEATIHPHRVLQELAGTEVTRGVALNPGTPVEVIEPLLDDLELVLILAVNPGWGGQAFLPGTAARVARALELAAGRGVAVGVDGGITAANVGAVAALRPDVIVTGSAVFSGGEPEAAARTMLAEIEHAAVGAAGGIDG